MNIQNKFITLVALIALLVVPANDMRARGKWSTQEKIALVSGITLTMGFTLLLIVQKRNGSNIQRWWYSLFAKNKKSPSVLAINSVAQPTVEEKPVPVAAVVTKSIMIDESYSENNHWKAIQALINEKSNIHVPFMQGYVLQNTLAYKKLLSINVLPFNNDTRGSKAQSLHMDNAQKAGLGVRVAIVYHKGSDEILGCVVFDEKSVRGSAHIRFVVVDNAHPQKNKIQEMLMDYVFSHLDTDTNVVQCSLLKTSLTSIKDNNNCMVGYEMPVFLEKNKFAAGSLTGPSIIYSSVIPKIR